MEENRVKIDKKIGLGDTPEKLGNLTQDEYQRCLTAADLATFVDVHTVQKPKSIFVVAQPGAGKTALKSFVLAGEQSRGRFSTFIEFNPDVISTHHKNYTEIIRRFPEDSYAILQNSFTRTALDDYLRPRAVQIRCNIMQEGTFGSTAGYLKIIDFQQHGGVAQIGDVLQDGSRQAKNVNGDYEVEIDVLAVNRFESLLSCFDREQYFVEHGLPPRAVTKENHDRAYNNMLLTIDEIEDRKLYDAIKVYRRGYIEEQPELFYISGDPRFQRVSDAIRHERNKQQKELFENPGAYITKMNSLKERVAKGNNLSLKKRLGDLEKEFYQELERNKFDSRSID